MHSDEKILTIALGEAAEPDRLAHVQRLQTDPIYGAAFARLVATRGALEALAAPALAPGFDRRVMAALRAGPPAEALSKAMGRQFWRLAPAALVAAGILLVLVRRGNGRDRPKGEPTRHAQGTRAAEPAPDPGPGP